jgi:hypothetical protein
MDKPIPQIIASDVPDTEAFATDESFLVAEAQTALNHRKNAHKILEIQILSYYNHYKKF